MRIAADLLTVVVCVVLLAFFAREYGRPASPPSPTVQDVHIDGAAHSNDRGIDDFPASEGINPDSVVFVASGELPVRGTPTLLLVDGEGLVTHIWIGLLDADREAEVLQLPGDERGQPVVGFRTDLQSPPARGIRVGGGDGHHQRAPSGSNAAVPPASA